MEAGELFSCSERAQWRAWLAAHFEDRDEIWFVFPMKGSGEPGVSYNDAVEEALCFGWIDGQAAALEEALEKNVIKQNNSTSLVRFVLLMRYVPSPSFMSGREKTRNEIK